MDIEKSEAWKISVIVAFLLALAMHETGLVEYIGALIDASRGGK